MWFIKFNSLRIEQVDSSRSINTEFHSIPEDLMGLLNNPPTLSKSTHQQKKSDGWRQINFINGWIRTQLLKSCRLTK